HQFIDHAPLVRRLKRGDDRVRGEDVHQRHTESCVTRRSTRPAASPTPGGPPSSARGRGVTASIRREPVRGERCRGAASGGGGNPCASSRTCPPAHPPHPPVHRSSTTEYDPSRYPLAG